MCTGPARTPKVAAATNAVAPTTAQTQGSRGRPCSTAGVLRWSGQALRRETVMRTSRERECVARSSAGNRPHAAPDRVDVLVAALGIAEHDQVGARRHYVLSRELGVVRRGRRRAVGDVLQS